MNVTVQQSNGRVYAKTVWHQVVLRLWIDFIAATFVWLTTAAFGLLIYVLGHSVWKMQFRVIWQSLTVLAVIHLALILFATYQRHLRIIGSNLSEIATPQSSPEIEAGTDAGIHSSVSRS